MDYQVIVDRAQVFRWSGSTIKAKVGALNLNTRVSGNPSGNYIILSASPFPGEEPPLAMYKADLSEAGQPPPPDPDPTVTPFTLEVEGYLPYTGELEKA